MTQRPARLVVVVGPSGAGKDTVLRWVAAHEALRQGPPRLRIARRTVTRDAGDASESHEAVGMERFEALLREGAFALHWSANDLRYGIRHEELQPLAAGLDVLVNGSRAHLRLARLQYPTLFAVAVASPPELLRGRLLARGREQAGGIEARLRRNAAVEGFAVDAEVLNDATPEDAGRRLLAALGLEA